MGAVTITVTQYFTKFTISGSTLDTVDGNASGTAYGRHGGIVHYQDFLQ